jgi:hypothetical protein
LDDSIREHPESVIRGNCIFLGSAGALQESIKAILTC